MMKEDSDSPVSVTPEPIEATPEEEPAPAPAQEVRLRRTCPRGCHSRDVQEKDGLLLSIICPRYVLLFVHAAAEG
jgi:hypothetical protein